MHAFAILYRKPWRRTFIFAHPLCLQGIGFRLVWRLGQCEGHPVKVTGDKKLKKGSLSDNSRSTKQSSKISTELSITADLSVWPPSQACSQDFTLGRPQKLRGCTFSFLKNDILVVVLKTSAPPLHIWGPRNTSGRENSVTSLNKADPTSQQSQFFP